MTGNLTNFYVEGERETLRIQLSLVRGNAYYCGCIGICLLTFSGRKEDPNK